MEHDRDEWTMMGSISLRPGYEPMPFESHWVRAEWADNALAAADRLAHQSIYTPFHEAYWQARGGHDKCAVCRQDSANGDKT
jgi:hypothetical protein